MAKCSFYLALGFLCCIPPCTSLDVEHFHINEPNTISIGLINRSAEILCSFNATTVYVYFENYTSIGYQGVILKKLNGCGTSLITLRNKYKTAPTWDAFQDDGVLTYLVIMIKNATQRIDLSMVKKKSGSKHRSYFFIIVDDSTDINELWLRSAFKKFWDIWVLNAVIMFWRDNDIQIYSYSPFSNRFLRQVNSSVTSREDLFPQVMPDMNGRRLRICLMSDEVRAIFEDGMLLGADGFMTWFVTNHLNATPIMQPANSFEDKSRDRPTNLSLDFCLTQVISESCDMALNTRFLSPSSFGNLVEHTVVYGRDDLCIIVPKSQPFSLFWNLFRSFEIAVWVVIALSFFVTYIFCRLLLPHANHTVLKLYSSMLGQPLKAAPPRYSAKAFLICWLSYCLLITSAYKCNLTSNLVFPRSMPDIDTLLDLANSNYEILIHARHQTYIDTFLNSSISYQRTIKQKTIPVADEFLLKKLDENDLSYAYLEKLHIASFRVNSRRHTYHGRPLFHLMSSCPIPFQSVYIVPYGSPYLGYLNTLVRRIQEHGFVNLWTRYMDNQFRFSGRSTTFHSHNNDDPVVLRLAHLQAAFCILFLGLILASGVLIWEIYGIYGIGMFIYNRRRWSARHLRALRRALLKK